MPSSPNEVQVCFPAPRQVPLLQGVYQATEWFLWFHLLTLCYYAERNTDPRGKKNNEKTWERMSIAGFIDRYFASRFPDYDLSSWAYFGIASTLVAVFCKSLSCPEKRELRLFSNAVWHTHCSTASIIQVLHQLHGNITHTLQISGFPL